MGQQYCPFQRGKLCNSDCPLYYLYDDDSGCAILWIAFHLADIVRKYIGGK